MLAIILSAFISFVLVYAIMPHVISIAVKKKLVALPDERSSHDKITPCLGGIPIFMGILFCSLLLTPLGEWNGLQYILSALVLVFMIGTKDDIEQISPGKKVVGLIVAITILVTRGEIRLESLYGLFGYTGGLPYYLSIAASAFTLLVISNAFNLIDGIDGLAGTVGIIAMSTFGAWFYMAGVSHLSIVALAAAGGLLAFLRFNLSSTTKTFMGDTGALVIGMLLGIMTIKFIDYCFSMNMPSKFRFVHPIGIAVAVLIIPLFDTIRVFTTRIIRGAHPMRPDRRHIHHLLIDSGLSHPSATFVLGLTNLLFIALAIILDPLLNLHLILAIEIGLALLLTFLLHRHSVRIKKLKKQQLV